MRSSARWCRWDPYTRRASSVRARGSSPNGGAIGSTPSCSSRAGSRSASGARRLPPCRNRKPGIDTRPDGANNRTMIAALLALIPLLPSPLAAPADAPAIARAYVPERVYDTQRKTFTDFESMLADLVRADVVFVGEQHDDPNRPEEHTSARQARSDR